MTGARAELLATYLARRGDLIRYFAVRLRSVDAAEDLVQEIYLRIASADPGEEVKNAGGYLYRLGTNLMLDRIRGERRSALRAGAWSQAHRTVLGKEQVADEPPADDAVAARERLDAIVAVMRELPEQTQRVFRMHKFEGLSHPEVAKALGISRSSVEKHVMAVLKRLSERLG